MTIGLRTESAISRVPESQGLPPASPGRRAAARRLATVIPVTVAAAIGAMCLYPGVAGSTSCAAWLGLGCAAFVALYVWLHEVAIGGMRGSRACLLAALIPAVILANRDDRIARGGFRLCRPAFENALAGHEPRPWLGVYHIREVITDPRGGVFFEVTASDFLFGGRSSGFVFRASPALDRYGRVSTPFGAGELTQIDADWSVYHATMSFF